METEQQNPHTANILIVDDTPANLQFLAAMFKLRGYKTRAALNGELALLAIKNEPPDLILLDVHMPDIDGIEVCKRLKADPLTTDIPIIFVSGEHEVQNKVKAFSSGGVDYITRPFQIDDMISRVSTHLDLQKQRAQLRETLMKMQELEVLRDSFVHMIIHDLRNPLWGIESYLELIKSDESVSLSPKITKYLVEAQLHTTNMIDMINSILDVNRMESATLTLDLMNTDLVDLCNQVIRGMEPMRRSRAITLDTQVSPANAMIDVGLIRRLITNLVSHAIRATPEKEGQINLSILQINDVIRINVTDNGYPILTEEHHNIFEKYAQANIALSGKGLNAPGLGLPFCKLAAEAHKGRIGIEKAAHAGNTFWLELPIAGPPGY